VTVNVTSCHAVATGHHYRRRRGSPGNTPRRVRNSTPFPLSFLSPLTLTLTPTHTPISTTNRSPLRRRNNTTKKSIYPAIDPEPHYAARTYSGKVVLVTGASRGVGRETALQYARAGASGVAIVGRTAEALAETRDAIVGVEPGAEVLVLAEDVRDVEGARGAVRRVLRRFGRLDILIANAGAITAFTPSE
jgi:hypothetical protein